MNCDTFRSHVDRMPKAIWPHEAYAHYEGCADCRAWWALEQTWQQVLASVPMPAERPSVWPGVMAAIAARRERPTTLSWEVVALSRYIVPALAALVLALSGVGWWGQTGTGETSTMPVVANVLVAEPATELAFVVEDADTILNQWVEAAQP